MGLDCSARFLCAKKKIGPLDYKVSKSMGEWEKRIKNYRSSSYPWKNKAYWAEVMKYRVLICKINHYPMPKFTDAQVEYLQDAKMLHN